jgi:hypothetical protein
LNDKTLIIIGIVAGVAALALTITFVGQGNVRHVTIFWTEKVEQTVIFEEIDGQVQLRGIKGISGEPNPTLLSRTSFAYILTVVNNGEKLHRLYIDGLEIQTDLLEPGEEETITIYPTEEGIYNYYDKRERLQKLGQIKIVTVVPSDEFQGFLKDMI